MSNETKWTPEPWRIGEGGDNGKRIDALRAAIATAERAS